MDIKDRIAATEKKFEEINAKRKSSLKEAEQYLMELTKLQGEWRVLNEMVDEQPKSAGTVSVEPETEN